jgi:hypothetical protein
LELNFHDIRELLSSFYLFVEEDCIFIPCFQPEAPEFLLPIIFLLFIDLMPIPLELILLLQSFLSDFLIFHIQLVFLKLFLGFLAG